MEAVSGPSLIIPETAEPTLERERFAQAREYIATLIEQLRAKNQDVDKEKLASAIASLREIRDGATDPQLKAEIISTIEQLKEETRNLTFTGEEGETKEDEIANLPLYTPDTTEAEDLFIPKEGDDLLNDDDFATEDENAITSNEIPSLADGLPEELTDEEVQKLVNDALKSEDTTETNPDAEVEKLREEIELQRKQIEDLLEKFGVIEQVLKKVLEESQTVEEESKRIEAAKNEEIADLKEEINRLQEKLKEEDDEKPESGKKDFKINQDIIIGAIDKKSLHDLAKDAARKEIEVDKKRNPIQRIWDRMTIGIREARKTAQIEEVMRETGSINDTGDRKKKEKWWKFWEKKKTVQGINREEALNASQGELEAIVERIALERNEGMHLEAGESEKILLQGADRELVVNVIKKFVVAENLDKNEFNQAKNSLITQLGEKFPEIFTQKEVLAENIWKTVTELRDLAKNSEEHAEIMDSFEDEVNIYIARAKAGVRTEAQHNTLDKLITSRIVKSTAGLFINEVTLATAIATVYEIGKNTAQTTVRTTGKAFGLLGGSMVAGGALTAFKENYRIKEDREWHTREMAQGQGIKDTDKKRIELDAYTYKSAKVADLIANLSPLEEKMRADEGLSADEEVKLIESLADIEARISLSNGQKIDLLSYSDVMKVESERTALDILRAKLKTKLKKTDPDLAELKKEIEKRKTELKGEVTEIDDNFKGYKAKKVAGAAIKGALTTGATAIMAQELRSFFDPNTTGFFERKVNELKGIKETSTNLAEKSTILNDLGRKIDKQFGWDRGKLETAQVVNLGVKAEKLSEVASLKIPDNYTVQKIDQSNFILNGADGVKTNIQLDADGNVSTTSLEALRKAGLNLKVNELGMIDIHKPGDFEVKTLSKIDWYGYGTKENDLNELSLMNPRINKDGMIEIMTTSNGISTDGVGGSIEIKKAVESGILKTVFRPDGGNQYLSFDVKNVDGKLVTLIDPKSEVGQYLFKVNGGRVENLADFVHIGVISPEGTLQSIATDVTGKGLELNPEILMGGIAESRMGKEVVVDAITTTTKETMTIGTEKIVEATLGVPLIGYDVLQKTDNSGKRADELDPKLKKKEEAEEEEKDGKEKEKEKKKLNSLNKMIKKWFAGVKEEGEGNLKPKKKRSKSQPQITDDEVAKNAAKEYDKWRAGEGILNSDKEENKTETEEQTKDESKQTQDKSEATETISEEVKTIIKNGGEEDDIIIETPRAGKEKNDKTKQEEENLKPENSEPKIEKENEVREETITIQPEIERQFSDLTDEAIEKMSNKEIDETISSKSEIIKNNIETLEIGFSESEYQNNAQEWLLLYDQILIAEEDILELLRVKMQRFRDLGKETKDQEDDLKDIELFAENAVHNTLSPFLFSESSDRIMIKKSSDIEFSLAKAAISIWSEILKRQNELSEKIERL